MEDYELPTIRDLIERVRVASQSSPSAELRLVRLNALFVYFQYSVAAVRLQEASIRAMEGGQHTNFHTHDEYEDCLLKLYSSAINAYASLRICLHFARTVVEDIPEEVAGRCGLAAYRQKHAVWAKEVIDMRDRIAAHPAEADALVWKPSMWSSDGRVGFVVRNLDDIGLSRKIILHPRRDLELLRSYLSGLAPLVRIALNFGSGVGD